MPPRQARGHARSLTRAHGARVARGARRDHEEGDGENHQESVMGERAPLTVFGGIELCKGYSPSLNKW